MKLLPKNPEFEEMQQICDMRLHFNITMTSQVGQPAAVRVFVCVIFTDRLLWEMFDIITAEILIWCARKVSYDAKTLLKIQITEQTKAPLGSPLK